MQTQLVTLLTDNVAEAAHLLQQGETVIFPTETVYGLGADALNPHAVAAIFAAKQRPADNPLIVHIHSLAQVEELTHSIPAYAWQLMERFFPGSLTLLLPKRPLIPDITTAGSDKVCLRMPNLPVALDFLRACTTPVAAPSANISGRPSPTRWQDCMEDMDGRVGAILKGPEATFGLESTIVDCSSGTRPVLMRPGAVTLEALQEIVPDILPKPSANAPITPGMKYRHYAPSARVQLLTPDTPPPVPGVPTAYIGLTPPPFAVSHSLVAGSIEKYARQLFSFFRECDRQGIVAIYAEPVPERGLGRALMNRLTKAVNA